MQSPDRHESKMYRPFNRARDLRQALHRASTRRRHFRRTHSRRIFDLLPSSRAVSGRPSLLNATFQHLRHHPSAAVKPECQREKFYLRTDNLPLVLLPILMRRPERLQVPLLPHPKLLP